MHIFYFHIMAKMVSFICDSGPHMSVKTKKLNHRCTVLVCSKVAYIRKTSVVAIRGSHTSTFIMTNNSVCVKNMNVSVMSTDVRVVL